MNQKILVSVVMITYGHEKYIREAIEGVLMQEGNFDLELIVANDCSLDATDAVVHDILKEHPRASCIHYFKHEENRGMMLNFVFALQQTKGDYIALCDGDDYWTDPHKLQKQADFLETNPDYVLCFHKVKILKTNGALVEDFITKVPKDYETQETLAKSNNYIHTPSVLFRNVINNFPPEFLLTPIGDYFLYVLLSEYGKLFYYKQEMAVYRHGVGVISGMDNFKIVSNSVKMYSCIIGAVKEISIKTIFINRQEDALTLYKNTFDLNNTLTIRIPFSFIHLEKILSEVISNPKKGLTKLIKKIRKVF